MVEQKKLFEVLRSKLPDQFNMIVQLEELLHIGTNAIYRRVRGDTALTFRELVLICQKFGISLDEIFNLNVNRGALFRYAPVNFTEQESYIAYINRLSDSLAFYKATPDTEILITALDIPFFYFLNYTDLMFFKLYAWNDTVTHTTITYEKFCNTLNKQKIIPVYQQMAKTWKLIPSKEIWTKQTLCTVLRLLEYYADTDAFEKKETVRSLLSQLNALMNDIKKYADEGFKGMKTPFHLYLCNVDFDNNFMLIKRGGEKSCTIRLFTVNSILTEHQELCDETEKWINDMIMKSTLISETSAKARANFFKFAQNEIDALSSKIAPLGGINKYTK